jgi:hypothetical protein
MSGVNISEHSFAFLNISEHAERSCALLLRQTRKWDARTLSHKYRGAARGVAQSRSAVPLTMRESSFGRKFPPPARCAKSDPPAQRCQSGALVLLARWRFHVEHDGYVSSI